MTTNLLLTSGMVNYVASFWPQNAGKGSLIPKGVKMPAICQKLYHTQIMTLMNEIFGMFTQFLYERIVIYTNLISNITTDQKRSKSGKKNGKI